MHEPQDVNVKGSLKRVMEVLHAVLLYIAHMFVNSYIDTLKVIINSIHIHISIYLYIYEILKHMFLNITSQLVIE